MSRHGLHGQWVRAGKLHAVIDFGSLSVGFPHADHSTLWDLPPQARQVYWNTYLTFVAECQARLQAIPTDTAAD